jgi:hypothetical protein
LQEVTISRPWHWGIAVLVDKRGDVPDVDPNALVSIGPSGAVILVRHAQDSNETFDDEIVWATAALHIRHLVEVEKPVRAVAADFVMNTPSFDLSVGDADGDVLIAGLNATTRVVVTVADLGDHSPDDVWIDLVSVGR